MQRTLAVFGATGQQGSSVIKHVRNNRQLAKQFKIRAITRDITKPASILLQQQGIEVVEADADDAVSLVKALEGCHTIFIVTAHVFDSEATAREIAHGKAMANAAITVDAKFVIFSSLPSVMQISDGKYQHVGHFDAKAQIEDYIRTLPIDSAFVALASYMQNFREALAPRPFGDGTYAFFNCMSPETQFVMVDVADTGKWVTAILAEPTRYEGKFVVAATEVHSLNEIAKLMSNASGKVVKYCQVPEKAYRGFLPDAMANDLVDMAYYFQDFGYYGPNSSDSIKLASQDAHGEPATFEQFLAQNPLVLE